MTAKKKNRDNIFRMDVGPFCARSTDPDGGLCGGEGGQSRRQGRACLPGQDRPACEPTLGQPRESLPRHAHQVPHSQGVLAGQEEHTLPLVGQAAGGKTRMCRTRGPCKDHAVVPRVKNLVLHLSTWKERPPLF